MASSEVSERSRGIALGMAVLLGVLGIHRFYVGKIGTGVLMFLTGGGACIWWILDIVMIATGEFRDRSGARLLEWGVDAADSERLSTREVLEEIEAINEDLDEVAERLEATERRLGDRTPTRSK